MNQDKGMESMATHQTINIKEAARILGFKSLSRLSQKAKRGEIPGFKAAKQWMFFLEDIVNHARSLQNKQRKMAQVDIAGDRSCRLAKRKIVHIGIPDSQSVELECKNLRRQLREQKHNSMRKSVDKT